MAKHVFIDTNILLGFYHFSKDDLEELRKLSHLIEQGEINLYLPRQVVDEFWRNRETKIAESLKSLGELTGRAQFPQLCKEYNEYAELQKLQREFADKHDKLMLALKADITARSLRADDVVRELFGKADVIPRTQEIIDQARSRMDVGNPPGKRGSLGDAINWETLLAAVTRHRNLQFIADDRDYSSPLERARFHTFLADEWKEANGGRVEYFRSLTDFFRSKYPQINLADEVRKDALITDLANSPNFMTTHRLIGQLSRFGEFTDAQAAAIATAAVTNGQVSWIAQDEDVSTFLRRVLDAHFLGIDLDLQSQAESLIASEEVVEPDDDLPF